MITIEQTEELKKWDEYLVYGDTEDGDIGVIGVKKDTPKEVIKEFKAWYKKTYPRLPDKKEAEETPNL